MDQPRGRKFSSQRCPFLWLRCLMKYHLEYCDVQFYQSLYILKSNAVYRFYLKRSFSPGNNHDKTQNEYYMPHCTWKSININQLCCNWENQTTLLKSHFVCANYKLSVCRDTQCTSKKVKILVDPFELNFDTPVEVHLKLIQKCFQSNLLNGLWMGESHQNLGF